MIKSQLFIGAALIVGVAVGYFMRGEDAAPKVDGAAAPAAKVAPRGKIADAGEKASNDSLRRRIRELELELEEMRTVSISATGTVVAAVKTEERPRPRNPREFMEEMKKKDPARFTQMTNRMAHFMRHHLQRTQNKLNFLGSIDTSSMSAAAQKTHERLQDLLEQREELRENMHDLDMDEETRRANFEKLRKVDSELRSVNASERRNLLSETAKNLGMSGDEAASFSTTMEQLFDSTSNSDMRPPPPPDGNPPH